MHTLKELGMMLCLIAGLTTISFYLFLWMSHERLPLLDPPVGFVGVPEPTDGPQVLATLSAAKLEELAEQAWNDRALDPDYSIAVRLFSMAYDKGARKKAGYRLGVANYRGLGVAKNFKKAEQYLSDPRLLRHRYARYYLGLLLADANNPDRDVEGAKDALSEAKNMGLQQAAEALEGLR